MDRIVVDAVIEGVVLVELGFIPDKTEIIQPEVAFASFLDYFIGLVALGMIVWLVLNRKNKTYLY
jgi:hypothetical protein